MDRTTAFEARDGGSNPSRGTLASLVCVYYTKLEPIFKTNDVAHSARVVA